MKLLDSWGEMYGAFLLLVGLVISILVDAAIVSYAVIFFCGLIVGRMYRMKKKRESMLFYLISFMFIVGYLAGALIRDRGEILIIIIFFSLGCYWGNYMMKKKLVR